MANYCISYKKIKNNKLKGFLQRILQETMKKKMILGTSDACSMRRSSHRPSNPVYYIEDCWILKRSGWIQLRSTKYYYVCKLKPKFFSDTLLSVINRLNEMEEFSCNLTGETSEN